MIRIGIVEDERLLLDDLVNNVDWEAWGIEVCFAERNGAKALRRMAGEYADIVLTDISMPVMNGIEMAEKIQQRYPHVQFIFLTSYNEVEYARSAIELNAVAYLSKPVGMARLEKAVREAVRRLEMISSAELGARLRREEQLIRLLTDGDDPEALEAFAGRWQVFGVRIAHFLSVYHTRSAAEVKWLTTEIREQLRYFLSCRCDGYCAVYLSKGEFIVAAEPSYDFSAMTAQDRQELADSVGASIGFDFLFVPSNPLIGPEEFRDRYRELSLLRDEAFYRYRVNLPAGGISRSREECVREVLSLIGDRDERALPALEKWFAAVRSRHVPRKTVIADCFRICETLLGSSPPGMDGADYDRRDMLGMLEELQNLDALEKYILSLRENLRAAPPASGDSGQDTVRQIIRYIGSHYAEAISAETLTKDFYLASNTIRALFKQRTGKTIHEYLTEVRLEKARRLLENPELRIKEIAARTGYRNISYFCKVFADMYGASPMNYRLRLPGRNGAFQTDEDENTAP